MSVLCPKCHRPFSKEFERKEIVDRGFQEEEQFTGTHSKTRTPVPVNPGREIVDFKYYYRCNHCGFEWIEVKEVKFDKSTS